MNIFLFIDMNEKQKSRIREVAAGDTVYVSADYHDDAARESAFADCEVVLGNVPENWLDKTHRLRWMQLESIGFNAYRHCKDLLMQKRIMLTNLPGFFDDAVAQSSLAGILAHYRGIAQLVLLKEKKEWKGEAMRKKIKIITGAHVVLFGYGGINRRLEELLAPFRCHITCFGKTWTRHSLNNALADADIIICAVPETDATVGVFDQKRLAILKDDALFVNVGRGSVVKEEALIDVLADHRIGGAVLDVTLDEPLPTNHPFWTLPNILLTQHSGGGSVDELARKIDVFAENFKRYRNRQPLHGVVDFTRGY